MKLKSLLIICLLSVLVSCELDSFLFNEKSVSEYKLPGNTIPDSLLELVSFKSGKHTLYGYWIQSNGDNENITILYCHGNKHNIDEYWDRVLMMHDLGYNVFIFDYRGYGMSEGESSEKGLYEDGTAALDFVLTTYQVDTDSLCLFGYSLGNVVSIYLAAEKTDPLCLIAESPFASANSLTQSSVMLDIPAQWLTKGEFDNAEKIKHIQTPFMLMHGGEDDFVRFRDNGKVIYENAPQPKSLELISSAGHSDIPEILGDMRYQSLIEQWINFSRNK